MIKRILVFSLTALVLSGCQYLLAPGDCANGKLDGRETGLDCGGGCAGCAVDALCLVDADCSSSVCAVNHCAAPSCLDGVLNGTETDVDCGGICGACASQPSCANGMKDGAETDVDCGGSCGACATGAGCVLAVDCLMGSCVNGKCGAVTCAQPLLDCGGHCVDTRFDPMNCGGCNMPCAPGALCGGGQCGAVSCTGGTLLCNGQCIDPLSNPAHCGICNGACLPGEACVAGACELPCVIGQLACGSTCVSADRDPLNCGGCNQPCAPGTACVGGQCSNGCSAPLMTCAVGPSCIDPRNDPDNCGGCGLPCPPLQHQNRVCVASQCAGGTCQPGFEDCNHLANDGCEADLSNDSLNCGLCGQACQGNDTCGMGRCCGLPPQGTYATTCTGCEACNGVLSCQCNDAMSIPRPASIPLATCPLGVITNCNGALLCNGC